MSPCIHCIFHVAFASPVSHVSLVSLVSPVSLLVDIIIIIRKVEVLHSTIYLFRKSDVDKFNV